MSIPNYIAWHKERKQMFYVLSLGLSDLNGRRIEAEINNGSFTIYPDMRDIILLPYTTVNDKDGKQIHVGYRVKNITTTMEYVVKFGFCKKYGFTGYYLESEDGLVTPLNGGEDGEANNPDLELIGHIYNVK